MWADSEFIISDDTKGNDGESDSVEDDSCGDGDGNVNDKICIKL